MTRRRSRMIESARTIQVPATTTRARALEKRYLRLAARIALRLWHEVPRVRACIQDLDFAGALYELLQPHLNGGERQSLDRALACGRRGSVAEPDALCDEDFELLCSDDDEEWLEVLPAIGVRLVLDKLQIRNFDAWLARKVPQLLARLDRCIADAHDDRPAEPALQAIAGAFGLDAGECALLEYLCALDEVPALRRLLSEVRCQARHQAGLLGRMLALPEKDIRRRIAAGSTLARLQLASFDPEAGTLADCALGSECLSRLRIGNCRDEADILQLLLEPLPDAEWRLEDYPHLHADGVLIAETLAQAALDGEKGVNALFYGAPGTGKTSFAASVAARVNLEAFVVRSSAEDGTVLERNGRLGAYAVAQALLAQRNDCVLVFDEVEDVFGGSDEGWPFPNGGRTVRNKGYLNRLLETSPVPTIWITNAADAIDPACKRRFPLSLSFPTPPQPVRRRIIERQLGALLADDRSGLIDRLAADALLQPAQFATARLLARLNDHRPAAEVIARGIAAQRELLYGARLPVQRLQTMVADPQFLNLDGPVSPQRILDALADSGHGRLCLHGLPGTGKTEFAHLIAQRLGRELIVRRGSDLRSCWVGETERNLAEAFATADPARSVLLIDEIDGFLGDRRTSEHHWEQGEVNELLQQMEDYPGIFVATTNLLERFDPAALRRFDFKLECRPLTPGQRRRLYAREVCGDADAQLPELVTRRLDMLDGLTLGDFANVTRQLGVLGEAKDNGRFLVLLAAERNGRQGD